MLYLGNSFIKRTWFLCILLKNGLTNKSADIKKQIDTKFDKKLSTSKTQCLYGIWSYQLSYPRYPHFCLEKMWAKNDVNIENMFC